MSVKDFLLGKKALAEADVVEYDGQANALDVELKAQFDAGVASVPVIVGGGFTQEQVDAAVALAVAPKDIELASVKVEKDQLQVSYDALVAGQAAAIQGAVESAEAALKAVFHDELVNVAIDNKSLEEKYK